MISLNCTNCQTLLEIDDAFAGGVCRCRHCGAIQTVPSHLKQSAGVTTGKTLYTASSHRADVDHTTGPNTVGKSGTGLDELAEIVASSGLSRKSLRRASSKVTERSAAPKQPPRNLTPLLIAAVLVIVVLIGMVAWMATRGATSTPDQASSPATGNVANAPVTPVLAKPSSSTPTFCGTPLTSSTVIYVLDCGQSTKDLFGYLREATFRSVETLGSDRKFQIVFWENGGTTLAYPGSGPAYATKGSIDTAKRQLEDVFPHGQTDALPAIKKAMSGNPGEIILATAKGWDLNAEFVNKTIDLLGSTKPKVHTFALGSGTDSQALKALAEKTGGIYRTLTEGSLRNSDQ